MKTLNVNSASTRGQAVPTPETLPVGLMLARLSDIENFTERKDFHHSFDRISICQIAETMKHIDAERDRLLAVNKTLVEALDQIAATLAAHGQERRRTTLYECEVMANTARAALKAGKV